ncbi:hypothetical protein AXG93_2390s1030 [Marchantia polymorpha subsp. ruderalis]|uniref:Peptidase A1 domain-containing protein n=1 Tax=Marchantia polymorpha subsp. ruderalis TaxID=1480154 RepID=A0A176WE95_MARPO|nr:hypothetical protein AXG93_2390s1030 [Marchantia polymorpha subsp. ruderalis]
MATLRYLGVLVVVAAAAMVLSASPSLSENLNSVFASMKHLDHHPDSPLHQAESTFAERILNAVKRSKARAAGLQNIVASGITPRGSYIMTISLGTPPQTKTAIVDTGSDLVWLQCAPCSSCYQQPDPVFDPSKSSSYHKIRYFSNLCGELPYISWNWGYCYYLYAYGDQSTTQGDLAQETLTLTATDGSTQSFPNFAFGCGRRNQGTFVGTDGLVGLGRGALSFPEQIGALIRAKFSYCLVDAVSSATESSPLIFGDDASVVANGLNLQYTPLVRNPAVDTFYYVKLNGIAVNNQPLAGIAPGAFALDIYTGRGGVILDSGTTITQLVDSAYIPFASTLQSLINYPQIDGSPIGLDLCYNLSSVSNPTFPSVTLQFQGVDLTLPANNLFLQVDDQGTSCLAFLGTSDLTIIGNIQQQNFYISYDVANERVGFAPVDSCANLSSASSATAPTAAPVTAAKDEF